MRTRNSIFVHLLWFALAVALPLMAIIGYGIYQKFEDERGAATATIKHARELGESRVGNSFSRSRSILESMAAGGNIQKLDLQEIRAEFAPLLRQRPEFKDIVLIDAQGKVLVAEGGYFGNRGTIAIESASAAKSFALGRPFRSPEQGNWHTIVSVPVHPGPMLLVVRMELSGLAERLLSMADASQPVVTVLNSDGVVLLRSHEIDSHIGRDLPDFKTIAEAVRGGVENGTFMGFDGAQRTFSASILPNTDLFVLASMPTREIAAGARKELRNNLIALFFITSLVLAIAYRFSLRISEPISRLAAVARAHGGGDAEVRASETGPTEVAETAHAFNEMITARKAAEIAKSESEERLDLALTGAELGLWHCDIRTEKTIYNDLYAKMLGYELEELVPPHFTRINHVHPDDRQRVSEHLLRLVNGEHAGVQIEYRHRRKNGDWIWIQDRGRIVEWDGDGRPVRAAGTHLDITERKVAEQALIDAKNRFQGLVNSIDGIVWEIDAATRLFTFVSQQAGPILGHPLEEWIGNPDFLKTHLHEDDRDWFDRFFGGAAGQRKEHDAAFRLLALDGRAVWFQASISVVRVDGRITTFRGVMLDVTRQREAAAEREALNRKVQETQKLESLGVLAGGIAHDFNNLLTGVLGNASLARLELTGNSPAILFIDQIEKAAMRAADLCKQMLAYAGRGRFETRRLDLNFVLRDITQLLEVSKCKKTALRFNLTEPLPPIEADVTQLRQVVMNLVMNASEAIGDSGGIVTIATSLIGVDREYIAQSRLPNVIKPGPYIRLEISDTGVGMSPETVSRIFDPFFTTKFAGRGLGLSAVLGIIRSHNGTIKVYSELGKGTTIKILLPVAGGPVDPRDGVVLTESSWRGFGRALVIDDEESIRSVVVGMLSALGFSPTEAGDGGAGIEEFRKDPAAFSIVLLDLTMPVLDGEETFLRIRAIRPDTKVILMSGFNEPESSARFTGLGLAGFLQKPFGYDTLAAKVRMAITGAALSAG